jgi:hypothetical protein
MLQVVTDRPHAHTDFTPVYTTHLPKPKHNQLCVDEFHFPKLQRFCPLIYDSFWSQSKSFADYSPHDIRLRSTAQESAIVGPKRKGQRSAIVSSSPAQKQQKVRFEKKGKKLQNVATKLTKCFSEDRSPKKTQEYLHAEVFLSGV